MTSSGYNTVPNRYEWWLGIDILSISFILWIAKSQIANTCMITWVHARSGFKVPFSNSHMTIDSIILNKVVWIVEDGNQASNVKRCSELELMCVLLEATGDLKHSPTFLCLLHALEFMSQPTAVCFLCRLPGRHQSFVHEFFEEKRCTIHYIS